jgi:pyrroline-5-carboxylate reductase
MGIAILSGVMASLDSVSATHPYPKWESHTPGTTTPTNLSDPSIPSQFIACVKREESAKKLRTIFSQMGLRGQLVEVTTGENLKAIQQADVVLLWYMRFVGSHHPCLNFSH